MLASQSIESIDDAVLGSIVHGLADRLDDEREGKVPTSLPFRRLLRKMAVSS